MWKLRLKYFLQDFRDETRASVAVEAALILPLLLWSYVAVIIFFDGFRTKSISEKAAFTISDMISRETEAITPAYMNGMHSLFDMLARSDGPTAIRVSVISYSGKRKRYVLQWSETRGGMEALKSADIEQIATHLPNMTSGEHLILVETHSEFDPPLDVGLNDLDIDTFVFTRPRFASQVVWERTDL